jgi:hypothetical protein
MDLLISCEYVNRAKGSQQRDTNHTRTQDPLEIFLLALDKPKSVLVMYHVVVEELYVQKHNSAGRSRPADSMVGFGSRRIRDATAVGKL